MTAAGLALDRIACVRGGRLLFRKISFALAGGDALLLAGPNGIGKSSLMRIAAGLLGPAAGTVSRSGALALADERLALDPVLPLAQALTFWARIDRADPARLARALDRLALSAIADVPVRMLSTGQRKRAVLARVIASGAPIWLLDEPANGLDIESCGRLAEAMAGHRRDGGLILAAAHQDIGLDDAQRMTLVAPDPGSGDDWSHD